MNAIEFVEYLKKSQTTNNMSKLPAKEYFDTPAGKQIIGKISSRAKVIKETTLEFVDFFLTDELKDDPLYNGRDFLSDMKDLGFSCQITSYHQDELPIKTYQFKI